MQCRSANHLIIVFKFCITRGIQVDKGMYSRICKKN